MSDLNADSAGAGSALGPGWSLDIHAFFNHWNELREGADIPTSEKFLDSPSPTYMSTSYICDLTDEGAMVRFHGTALAERWGRDFTGHEIHDRRTPEFKQHSLMNMRHVVDRPCGYVVRLAFSTSTGRMLQSELIQLPLSVKPGRPPRLVCHAIKDAGYDAGEFIKLYVKTLEVAWADLGSGVPDSPPIDLISP